jgi:hypothetical protein
MKEQKQVQIKVGEPMQIEFYGDYLTAIFDGETVWVAVKPIIENLGMDWATQYKKILSDPVLSQVIGEKPITARDGKRYMSLCLPLEYINGLLFKINPNKIPNPQVREKVIRYQKECYKALYEYFIADKVRRAYSFEEFIQWVEAETKIIEAKSRAVEKAARLINAVVRATKDSVLRDKLAREVLKQFGYEEVVKEAEKESSENQLRRLL